MQCAFNCQFLFRYYISSTCLRCRRAGTYIILLQFIMTFSKSVHAYVNKVFATNSFTKNMASC